MIMRVRAARIHHIEVAEGAGSPRDHGVVFQTCVSYSLALPLCDYLTVRLSLGKGSIQQRLHYLALMAKRVLLHKRGHAVRKQLFLQ